VKRLVAMAFLAVVVAMTAFGRPPSGPARDIHVENGTTLDVAVTVNGTVVETVRAGVSKVISRAVLADLPWDLVATSPSGRRLVSTSVDESAPGAANAPATGGIYSYTDLTCGRLLIWIGTSGPVDKPALASIAPCA
jgi:hypothetical protein